MYSILSVSSHSIWVYAGLPFPITFIRFTQNTLFESVVVKGTLPSPMSPFLVCSFAEELGLGDIALAFTAGPGLYCTWGWTEDPDCGFADMLIPITATAAIVRAAVRTESFLIYGPPKNLQ